jgi:hypothetical protein
VAARGLDLALLADVLRLDLLSRYGGVWADATFCPGMPLEYYVDALTVDSGTFLLSHHDSQHWPDVGDEFTTSFMRNSMRCTGLGDLDYIRLN